MIEIDEAPKTGESLFFNQELSWLEFNKRVLEEALDKEKPLLERVRFVSIYANNLDEFFMVRVSGLRGQLTGGVLESPPDNMTPEDDEEDDEDGADDESEDAPLAEASTEQPTHETPTSSQQDKPSSDLENPAW